MTTTKVFKSEALENCAKMLQEGGLDVYYTRLAYRDKPPSWFYFTDGTHIGYCQADRYGSGVRFGTVHKPNQKVGTGYNLQPDGRGLVSPTIKDAEKAFQFGPSWASLHDHPHIVKYKNIDEFLAKQYFTYEKLQKI